MTYALTHTMTKAQAHSAAANQEGFHAFAADMTMTQLTDALVAHLEARPGVDVAQLEELERRIGRVAWQRGRV